MGQRMPNRRRSVTFYSESQDIRFTCTISRFDDGSLAEMFLRNHKAGSMAGINAQDAAVICALAWQHGVSRDLIRRALMRDARGRGSGSLACALDQIADQERGNG
jgi:hypothetical protein